MHTKLFALVYFCLQFAVIGQAQNYPAQVTAKPKVGIFIPLYLDSAFDAGGSYKFGTNVPKFALSGLEFYSGVQLALDSLEKEGLGAEVFIIDSKDKYRSVFNHINIDLKDATLFIGMTQNVTELRILAEAAHAIGIPFVSATLPNDGGVVNNPSLVILNSTLKTHCKAICDYLIKNYSKDNVVLLHKTGVQEDKIKLMMEYAYNNANVVSNWKKIDMPDNVSVGDLLPLLDSTKNNVIMCGTLDTEYGSNLIKKLSSVRKTYRSTVIGMPTWYDIHTEKSDYKGVELIYSTPFLTNSGNTNIYNSVTKQFKANIHSRPSDLVFRGFEVTYHFIKNLLANQAHILDLSDKRNKIFSDFDLQAVSLKNQSSPDYYENKKIYFVKRLDGIAKGVN